MHFDQLKKADIERASALLRTLAHPLRITLMNYIESHQPVKVQNIHSDLNLDQSITSQHLRILRDGGVVKTLRDGKYVLYLIDNELMNSVISSIKDFDSRTLAHRKKKR